MDGRLSLGGDDTPRLSIGASSLSRIDAETIALEQEELAIEKTWLVQERAALASARAQLEKDRAAFERKAIRYSDEPRKDLSRHIREANSPGTDECPSPQKGLTIRTAIDNEASDDEMDDPVVATPTTAALLQGLGIECEIRR